MFQSFRVTEHRSEEMKLVMCDCEYVQMHFMVNGVRQVLTRRCSWTIFTNFIICHFACNGLTSNFYYWIELHFVQSWRTLVIANFHSSIRMNIFPLRSSKFICHECIKSQVRCFHAPKFMEFMIKIALVVFVPFDAQTQCRSSFAQTEHSGSPVSRFNVTWYTYWSKMDFFTCHLNCWRCSVAWNLKELWFDKLK